MKSKLYLSIFLPLITFSGYAQTINATTEVADNSFLYTTHNVSATMHRFFNITLQDVQNDTITPYGQKQGAPLRYSGQLSGWAQYAPDLNMNFWIGGRYIPQFNYAIPLNNSGKIDFEASANILGEMGAKLFSEADFDGNIKPYRAWVRYSSNRTELRFGLQKINFGSAQMLRPLMWFDSIDPRDPLQLTDGVWALLWRYYFNNNTNIWLWGLYGNKNLRGMEMVAAEKQTPEVGGRIQVPIPRGEVALSYHRRSADIPSMQQLGITLPFDRVGESRVGFDIRMDVGVGLWLEGSWTKFNQNLDMFTNQEIATLGTDFTFGVGNGLTTTFEHLVFSYDKNSFAFANLNNFSGLSLSYPINMFDSISAMAYYDWSGGNPYIFINWQKQFNNLTFYLMGYWNPKSYILPGQMGNNRFTGKGIQLMVVWNH
jgi:hypothetical protein